MAGTARRVNSRPDKKRVYRTYEEGSAVRELEVFPEEQERRKKRSGKPKVSVQTRQNRRRAMSMSPGYLVFLSAVCVATLLLCVQYLQLKASYTEQTEYLDVLESDLSQLKSDNDAYYNQVQASVDLEEIRRKATEELGMHYADESQIEYYQPEDSSYVRQYQDVPGSER